jgi:hypothetical protein
MTVLYLLLTQDSIVKAEIVTVREKNIQDIILIPIIFTNLGSAKARYIGIPIAEIKNIQYITIFRYQTNCPEVFPNNRKNSCAIRIIGKEDIAPFVTVSFSI